jgi:hypothetical protein
MAWGVQKTPPNNRSPIITCSHLDSTIIPEIATTSEPQLVIPIEPATLLPQGIDVQHIIKIYYQSTIRTQGALARHRQFGEQSHWPLDFPNQ